MGYILLSEIHYSFFFIPYCDDYHFFDVFFSGYENNPAALQAYTSLCCGFSTGLKISSV